MTTIVILPKTSEEKDLLTKLLMKMNIEIRIVEDFSPNSETQQALDDVKNRKGKRAGTHLDLF